MPSMIYSIKEMARVAYAQSSYIKLVDETTNDDPWGPTGQQMDEVCRTYRNGGQAAEEILSEILLRLEHRKDSWRRCYKSLLLLDHMARTLPDRQVRDLERLIPLLNTIARSFYHTDSKGVDQGHNVRERAKKLTALLQDPEYLASERKKSAATAAKVSGTDGGGGDYGGVGRFHNNAGGNNVQAINASAGGGIANRYTTFAPDNYIGAGSGYDAYQTPSANHANPNPGRPLTKEEQEEADMAFAARLQREEESRSGTRVTDTDIGRRLANEGQQAALAREREEWQKKQEAAMKPRNNGVPARPAHTGMSDEERMARELQARLDRGEDMETAIAALTKSSGAGSSPAPNQGTQQVVPQQTQPQPKPQQVIDPFAIPSPSPQTTQQPKAGGSADLDFFADIPQGNVSQKPIGTQPSHQPTDLFGNTATIAAPKQNHLSNDLDFFGGATQSHQQQSQRPPQQTHDDFFSGPSPSYGSNSKPTTSAAPSNGFGDDFFGPTSGQGQHQSTVTSDPLMQAQLSSLDALTNTQRQRQAQMQSQQGSRAPAW